MILDHRKSFPIQCLAPSDGKIYSLVKVLWHNCVFGENPDWMVSGLMETILFDFEEWYSIFLFWPQHPPHEFRKK